MISLLRFMFGNAKIVVSVLIGALTAIPPAYLYGVGAGKNEYRLAAHEAGIERINKAGERNAEFNKLSNYDRCLAILRDSELQGSICDQWKRVSDD